MKDSQLSARLAGVPERFLEHFPQWLAIDASLSFKTVTWSHQLAEGSDTP